MKRQDMKDRMDERRGMERYERSESRGSVYKNEVDKPEQPMEHHIPAKEMGWEWAGDAADTAYGQAGESGCREDYRKIQSQFKDYGWK